MAFVSTCRQQHLFYSCGDQLQSSGPSNVHSWPQRSINTTKPPRIECFAACGRGWVGAEPVPHQVEVEALWHYLLDQVVGDICRPRVDGHHVRHCSNLGPQGWHAAQPHVCTQSTIVLSALTPFSPSLLHRTLKRKTAGPDTSGITQRNLPCHQWYASSTGCNSQATPSPETVFAYCLHMQGSGLCLWSRQHHLCSVCCCQLIAWPLQPAGQQPECPGHSGH